MPLISCGGSSLLIMSTAVVMLLRIDYVNACWRKRRRLYEVHDEWSRKAINGDGRRNRLDMYSRELAVRALSNGSGLAGRWLRDCRPYGSGLSAKTWHRN
ncbi:hypothetical protein ACVXHB_22120 [Escherichia coli]